MRSRATVSWMIAALLAIPVAISASPAAGATAPTTPIQPAREVRTTWTSEFGLARPSSVAYVPSGNEFLVAGSAPAATDVVRLDADEQSKGSLQLPALSDPSTLAYDAKAGELTGVNDGEVVVAPGADLKTTRPRVHRDRIADLQLQDAQGSTFDPATGVWYVLDARGRNIVRVANRRAAKHAVSASRSRSCTGRRCGVSAFNPNDGLLYVGSPDEHLVYAVDTNGKVKKGYDLAGTDIRNQMGMTFAPSADTTDPAARQNLFVAQSGDSQNLGGVTEVTLAAAAAVAVPTITASLVRTIATSTFNPASPDSSGVAYIGPTDRMQIVDSEVDETTGAGYHGANMWQFTRAGFQTATGTTFPRYSKEPTGVAYDPVSNTMFISDDSTRKVWVVKPGPDTQFGNADDIVTSIDAKAVGSTDTEDPAFDPVSRNLFFSDAVSTEVYRVNPVNGVFGDGNDVITHFDVGAVGPTDSEGLAYYAPDDALLVGDRPSRKIYEVTKTGTLLRIIDAKTGNYNVLSGLTVAPASDNSGRLDFWIASRGVDNGAQPTENDGKVIEVSIGGPTDAAPTVSVTAPAEGATVSGASVSVQASASDDHGVTQVQFFDGSTSLGTDTNGGDGWSVNWNTTSGANGAHTIRATATDTIGQTGTDTNNVTVNNVAADVPPTVSVTAPAEGATVSGASVSVQASASDDHGVTQVQFFDGSTSLGTDTNGGDGWSVNWNTTSGANGAHTIRATATDTIGQTGTDTNNVTVNNVAADAPPTVSVTAPAEGATVSGASVSVQASASDDHGVTQVQFFDGSTSLGTDTNGGDGWSVNWNTTSGANGAHTIRATATDTIGQTGTDTNNVTVNNVAADVPPTVSVTAPAEGATVSGASVSVQASASDDHGVTQVQFFDGSTSLGTDTNGGDGWSVNWNTTSGANGAHTIRATATDTIGQTGTDTNNVTVNNGGGTLSLDIPIVAGGDDIEERTSDGRIDSASTDLDMMLDNTVPQSAVGLRFTSVGIPHGATITNAYVQFKSDETSSEATSLTINGLALDNAAPFATKAFSLSTVPRTAAAVGWNVVAWVERQQGLDQRTPNLAPVLQEIFDRQAWVSGNSLSLVITGSGRRVAKSFEAGAPAVLHIEYTTG